MVEPRFRWTFAEELVPSEAAVAVAAAQGISTRLAGLLAARGAVSGEDLIAWFADPLEGLHDPAALPDAASVLPRVRAARDRGEKVLVFGDFDADGLTGLAIMTLALRRFGVAVEPYVPSRLDEGHGLSIAALDAAVDAPRLHHGFVPDSVRFEAARPLPKDVPIGGSPSGSKSAAQ